MGTIETITKNDSNGNPIIQDIHEIYIGDNPTLNGLKLYRRFDIESNFQASLKVDENFCIINNNALIKVCYLEYYKNLNNEVVITDDIKIRQKSYFIHNLPDEFTITFDEVNDPEHLTPISTLTNPAWNAVTDWFRLLAKGGVTIPNGDGIIESIELTLAAIPMGIPDGFVLPKAFRQ